jgi:L-alanine-DL-glutamate epimerase-like enolase superfamily enzyme
MKIADVEALQLRLPNVEEIADGTQDVLVIRIHTDAGLTGIGEVSSQSYVCKAIFEAPRSAERRHGLANILRGQDPLDVEGLWQRMYFQTSRYGMRGAVIHAISGADLALWDLRGKALGRPIHELLGATYRKTVRAYASYLFGSTPQATADLGREALDLGLTAMKFGWGPLIRAPRHWRVMRLDGGRRTKADGGVLSRTRQAVCPPASRMAGRAAASR